MDSGRDRFRCGWLGIHTNKHPALDHIDSLWVNVLWGDTFHLGSLRCVTPLGGVVGFGRFVQVARRHHKQLGGMLIVG